MLMGYNYTRKNCQCFLWSKCCASKNEDENVYNSENSYVL